jgi:hypothetical protein
MEGFALAAMRRRKPKPLEPGQGRYEAEIAAKPQATPWKRLRRAQREWWDWMETQQRRMNAEAENKSRAT